MAARQMFLAPREQFLVIGRIAAILKRQAQHEIVEALEPDFGGGLLQIVVRDGLVAHHQRFKAADVKTGVPHAIWRGGDPAGAVFGPERHAALGLADLVAATLAGIA